MKRIEKKSYCEHVKKEQQKYEYVTYEEQGCVGVKNVEQDKEGGCKWCREKNWKEKCGGSTQKWNRKITFDLNKDKKKRVEEEEEVMF